MTEENNKVNLVEPSFYGDKNKITAKAIVLTHWKNCIIEGSKEMHRGGVKRRIINGEVIQFNADNQVEIFINHVEMLKRALFPHVEYSQETVDKLNTFESTRQKYIKAYRSKRNKLHKWYNSFSTRKNPDGYSEREINSEKYRKIKQHLEEVYHEKMLELYQEQLFPYLTKLMDEREMTMG